VTVTDDGVGLDPASGRRGLGLRGIDERVKELRGSMTISRRQGAGTTLSVLLPVPAATTETAFARVAG
jgi:signal transduction histidine kinase